MSINQAFILSAGMGTRMGELGKLLPKPLWNLFETTLLGLQIKYVQSLGVEIICVNTHHQSEQISSYLQEKFPNVRISFEKKLLGSGGGIHQALNEKILDNTQPLAVFNSDSFLFLPKDRWEELYMSGQNMEVAAALFMSPIKNDDHYNAVVLDNDGMMLSIEKKKDKLKNPVTYSGFGIVYPKFFGVSRNESSFFSTIADFKNKKVFGLKVNEPLVDFGTLEIYKRLIITGINKETTLYKCPKEV